jgi:glycosyltransferase involved in cell wall biosynthesis
MQSSRGQLPKPPTQIRSGSGSDNPAPPGKVPLVSIIVPTLNNRSTIPRCLASVLTQTHPSIELIVVDGGSTDGTTELLPKSAIKLIRPGLRRSSARRLGAEHAQGDFLLFLDSDQVANPHLVEDCLRVAIGREVSAVKIPEELEGVGIWIRCERIESALWAQSDDLTYPRFFSRSAYLEIGEHRAGLEEYLEDRDLYLRLRSRGLESEWSPSVIVHILGHLNPWDVGSKGAKTARDSPAYYRENQESLMAVIRPRLHQLFSSKAILFRDPIALFVLPVYLLVSQGPKLLVVLGSK